MSKRNPVFPFSSEYAVQEINSKIKMDASQEAYPPDATLSRSRIFKEIKTGKAKKAGCFHSTTNK